MIILLRLVLSAGCLAIAFWASWQVIKLPDDSNQKKKEK